MGEIKVLKKVYKNKELKKKLLDHVFIDLRDKAVINLLKGAYEYPSQFRNDKEEIEKYFYKIANGTGAGEHAYDFIHRDLKYEGEGKYPLKSLIKLLKQFNMYNKLVEKIKNI